MSQPHLPESHSPPPPFHLAGSAQSSLSAEELGRRLEELREEARQRAEAKLAGIIESGQESATPPVELPEEPLPLSPIVRQLLGIARGSRGVEEYHEHLRRKYLGEEKAEPEVS